MRRRTATERSDSIDGPGPATRTTVPSVAVPAVVPASSPHTVTYPELDLRDMTVTALLSVAPVADKDMAEDIAATVAALDEFDVGYETNPMGTVIEADDVGELFDAVEAAHGAIDADRVSTVLKIDDKRTSDESARSKVESVEAALGREPKRERE